MRSTRNIRVRLQLKLEMDMGFNFVIHRFSSPLICWLCTLPPFPLFFPSISPSILLSLPLPFFPPPFSLSTYQSLLYIMWCNLNSCLVSYHTINLQIISLTPCILSANWSKGIISDLFNQSDSVLENSLQYKFVIQHFQSLIIIGLINEHFIILTNQI